MNEFQLLSHSSLFYLLLPSWFLLFVLRHSSLAAKLWMLWGLQIFGHFVNFKHFYKTIHRVIQTVNEHVREIKERRKWNHRDKIISIRDAVMWLEFSFYISDLSHLRNTPFLKMCLYVFITNYILAWSDQRWSSNNKIWQNESIF